MKWNETNIFAQEIYSDSFLDYQMLCKFKHLCSSSNIYWNSFKFEFLIILAHNLIIFYSIIKKTFGWLNIVLIQSLNDKILFTYANFQIVVENSKRNGTILSILNRIHMLNHLDALIEAKSFHKREAYWSTSNQNLKMAATMAMTSSWLNMATKIMRRLL